jgi:hypothetical protein
MSKSVDIRFSLDEDVMPVLFALKIATACAFSLHDGEKVSTGIPGWNFVVRGTGGAPEFDVGAPSRHLVVDNDGGGSVTVERFLDEMVYPEMPL